MKKIFLKAFVIGLVAFGVQPIHAEGFVPYGRVCSCGNGTYYVVSKVSGSWFTANEVKCNSHAYGTDLIEKRPVTTTYKCNACGRGHSTNTTEQRRICHGYDR